MSSPDAPLESRIDDLAVLGAVPAFAIDPAIVPNMGLKIIGYIIMGAGFVGFIASLATNRPSRVHRVTESRVAADPLTGDRIIRTRPANRKSKRCQSRLG